MFRLPKRKTAEDLELEREEALKQDAKSKREKLALYILNMLDEPEHWCAYNIQRYETTMVNLKSKLKILVDSSDVMVMYPDEVMLPDDFYSQIYKKTKVIKAYYEEEKAGFVLAYLEEPFTIKIDYRQSLKEDDIERKEQLVELRSWFLEIDFEKECHYSEKGFAWFKNEADAILFKTAWG